MDTIDLIENRIAKEIYFCALKVHRALGPGLLESAYEECLCYELRKEEFLVEKQKSLPLVYEDIKLEVGYRIDLFVENCVIVEVKAVDILSEIHTAQLLTYLKLTNCKLGLLINFNVTLIKNGVKRIANGL